MLSVSGRNIAKGLPKMSKLALRFGSLVLALISFMLPQSARAIIVFQDPGRLTTMPTVGGVNPGWQYIGSYGAFTGMPIGPRAWVTAEHVTAHTIGSASSLNYDNAGQSSMTNYSSTLAAVSGDLAIMTLDANQPSFTSWAPVWADPLSLVQGTSVYMYGRGTERGAATTGGWQWGNPASALSFGTNNFDGYALDNNNNYYLAMSFTQPTGGNGLPTTEGTFSTGDSGGAIFAYNTAHGRWELAGVNYGVDVYSQTSGGSAYYAALYDARGYYDGTTLVSGPSPVPVYAYSTALATKWSLIAPYTVPEPGTWVMAAIATAGMIGLIYRRSS